MRGWTRVWFLLGLAAGVAWGVGWFDRGGEPPPDLDATHEGPSDGPTSERPHLEGSGRVEGIRDPQAHRAIRVRVQDLEGAPRPGVRVTLSIPASGSGTPGGDATWQRALTERRLGGFVAVHEGTTNASGLVHLEGLPLRGMARVRAHPVAPWGRASRGVDADRLQGDAPVVLVVSRGSPARIRVRGAQQPIHIRGGVVLPPDAPRRWMALDPRMTDAEGHAHWQALPQGHVTLDLLAPEAGVHWHASRSMPWSGTWEIPLPEAGPAAVSGRVLDPEGEPVPGAELVLSTRRPRTPEGPVTIRAQTRSDDQGRYRFPHVHGRMLQSLDVRASGHVLRQVPVRDTPLPPSGDLDLDVVLPRARVVEGTVVDEAGHPVSGARVQWIFLRPGARLSGELRRPASPSDEEGRFRLEGVPGGPISVFVNAPGYIPQDPQALRSMALPADDGSLPPIVLVAGGEIRGVVVDEEGQPVEGARVQIARFRRATWEGNWFRASATSDAEGVFVHRGSVPPRLQVLGADGGGRRSDLVLLSEVASLDDVRLVLRTGCTIQGRVIDALGKPVARVLVKVHGLLNRPAEARTGPDGRYAIRGLPPGAGKVEFLPGSAVASVWRFPLRRIAQHAVRLEDWGRTLTVDARTDRAGDLGGFLVDDQGAPLASVALRVAGDSRGSAPGTAYVTTQADGSFQLQHLPPGEFTIWQGQDLLGSATPGDLDLRLEGTRTTQAPQDMSSGHVLTVKVLDSDGRPVAWASGEAVQERVRGSRHMTFNIRDGQGHIPTRGSIQDGAILRVQIRGALDMLGDPLNVLPFDESLPVQGGMLPRVRLRRAQVLSGTIRERDGPPAADLSFHLHWTPAGETRVEARHGKTDAQGRFSVPALSPGRGELWIHGAGRYLAVSPVEVSGLSRSVAVVLDPGMAISGRVIGPSGRPVPGAFVRFVEERDAGQGGVAARSHDTADAQGRFRMAGVPPGVEGILEARIGDNAFSPALRSGVRAGASNVEVRLEPPHRVEGRLLIPEVLEAVAGQVHGTLEGPVGAASKHKNVPIDEEGRFRVGPLPRGSYVLRWSIPAPGAPIPPRVVDVPAPPLEVTVRPARTLKAYIDSTASRKITVQWGAAAPGIFRALDEVRTSAVKTFTLRTHADGMGRLYAWQQSSGLMAWMEDVRVGASAVRIVLVPGASLSGKVHDPDGRERRRNVVVEGPVRRSVLVGSDGTWIVRGLPEGTYAVQAWEPETGRRSDAQHVEAGATGMALAIR